jgi:hypothetical protein
VELKLNGTQHLLVYADDLNLLGYDVDNKEKGHKLELTLVRRENCLVTRM